MADASYDVVVVGGGNKSLIACMYLTKYAGMSVGIFEERHELASGWSTEEAPAPGFLANLCSHNMANLESYFLTLYEDFPEWIEYGVQPLISPVAYAACFPDNTWCGVYSEEHDPTQEKTAKLFARFSEKDAETWLRLWDKAIKYWKSAVFESIWNPPPPFGTPDAQEKLFSAFPESGADPQWLFMTPWQALDDLFESPEVKITFAKLFLSWGINPQAYGMGILVISMLLGNINNGNFAGGTHTLAHATQRVILENGGKVFTRHPVQKIIVENGVAKGIRLEDGTEVEAKKAVLSGVDPYHLCVELVGEPHLSSDLIRRIKNLERDWSCITWYTWALQEKPRYLAEQFDPDIGNCKWIYLASSKETGMQDLLDEANERLLRHWPKSAHVVAEDNSYIPGTAPPGKASILTETYVLPAHSGSDQEWKQREKDLAEMVISQWNKYAPNINWDNVIGYVPVTPYFTAQFSKTYGPLVGCNNVLDPTPVQSGRFRPLLELSSGRMPVKNLYATGAGWHPHCGAMGFQGYNIYKIMAEDFGLSKPWEEKGRPY